MNCLRKFMALFSIFAIMIVSMLTPVGPSLALQVQNTGGGDAGSGAVQPAEPVAPTLPESTGGSGNSGRSEKKSPAAQPAEEETKYGCADLMISGHKYEDLDGDGILDPNEPGVPGWAIYLNGKGPIFTNADGYYKFTGLDYGIYLVSEGSRPGWYNTTGHTSVSVDLCRGGNGTADFLNSRYGKISGHKYEDLDCDGSWDAGEPGIECWAITLNGIKTVVTGGGGYYEFTGLKCGKYLVSEECRPGWSPTSPILVEVNLTSNGSAVANFFNCHYGKISGHKYEDLDCDGKWDEGEPGIGGWAITLTTPLGKVTTTTCSDGSYEFSRLPCGDYTVCEGTAEGWYPTGPTEVKVHLGSNGSAVANFFNCRYGKISGHKYEDLDCDGSWDEGEPGVSGWAIYLNGASPVFTDAGGASPVLTDANGYYEFTGLSCGDYLVSEGTAEGWYPTSPTSVPVTLCSGSSGTADFLNCRYGKISGYKYEDLNGDGVLDPGEPGISGWTIYLNGEDYVQTDAGSSVLTDADGYYEFTGLSCGDYLVSEGTAEGWYPTSPTSVPVTLCSGGSGTADFLNTEYARISGWKYEDPDRDGVHDAGEPPMPGVTIELRDKDGNLIDSTVTDAEGYFEFTGLVPGEYIVAELVPDGYEATTPAEVTVQRTSGDSGEVVFLNASIHCSIAGTKWDDLDADGIAGSTEPGLEGVTIQLWSGDTLVEEIATGVGGEYLFENVEPGTYTVKEVVPTDMYATSPISIMVILESGEDLTGVDFLNARYGSIAGTKWDDPNQDGVHQSSEAGVPGVTITLTRNGAVVDTAVTAANGAYLFDKLAAGTYVVTETLPSGTTNTTPLSVSVTLEAGEAVIGIDFLNVAVAGEIITPPVTPATTTTETAETQLPYTGLNMLPWLLTAGLLILTGLLTLILGLAFNRR